MPFLIKQLVKFFRYLLNCDLLHYNDTYLRIDTLCSFVRIFSWMKPSYFPKKILQYIWLEYLFTWKLLQNRVLPENVYFSTINSCRNRMQEISKGLRTYQNQLHFNLSHLPFGRNFAVTQYYKFWIGGFDRKKQPNIWTVWTVTEDCMLCFSTTTYQKHFIPASLT